MPHSIPPDVRGFLRRYIQTVEQLDILLTLRSQKEREWTVPDVYARVRTSEQSVAMRLAIFAEQGLLKVGGAIPVTYLYAAEGELDRLIAAAGDALQTRRVKVLEIIFGTETDAGDADPAKSFADAFRFRPKRSDEAR